MVDWIDPKLTFTIRQVKGTTGGATGKIEFLCEAEPGISTSAAQWRLRKFIYDDNGFMIQVLWASGDRKFDKIQTSYAGYTYS